MSASNADSAATDYQIQMHWYILQNHTPTAQIVARYLVQCLLSCSVKQKLPILYLLNDLLLKAKMINKRREALR